jgi:hypothetical protein
MTLEVFGETAAAADPSQGALDDPTVGKNDEAMQLVTFDDLQFPGAGLGDGCGCFPSLVAGIGEDALDEGEGAARLPQHLTHAVAILNVGGMHDDTPQEAERIDQDVPLAARNLLARIEALRVQRGAPF